MTKLVYVAAEVVEDQGGMVQARLLTGFGDPVVAVSADKLVDAPLAGRP